MTKSTKILAIVGIIAGIVTGAFVLTNLSSQKQNGVSDTEQYQQKETIPDKPIDNSRLTPEQQRNIEAKRDRATQKSNQEGAVN